MSQKPSETKEIDLSPDKQIYQAAAVDVSPVGAVEELGDNALDNWARVSQRVDPMTIEITAEDGVTRVEDDSGGLEADDIRILFALGSTFQEEVDGSIGAYGIGAKKAIVRLGEKAVVKSRSRDADVGVGFRIDQDWLERDDEWKTQLEEFDDIEAGTTVIEVESSETVWDDDRQEQLRSQLSKTYRNFLSGKTPQGGNLTIKLNGDELEPPEEIDWSYTPFDGLHPRKYRGIELRPKGLDDPVYMDVTVGQMRSGDAQKAGTDIYCQGRLVTAHERGEIGGYGSVAENKIGNFTSQNNRTRVVVELRTDGDSADLPWDAQKSTIDPYDRVSQAMYDWLRRIVRPYFKADMGKVPGAFVEPYDADHEHAANGGGIEELDYSGKSNVMDKPDEDRTMVKEVRRAAEAHARKGVMVTDAFDEKYMPAYQAHVERQFNGPPESLEIVETLDEDIEDEEDEVPAGQHISEILDDIDGAGASKEEALVQADYVTVDDLEGVTVEDLTQISGIGNALATKILDAVTPDEEEEVDETEGAAEEAESEDDQFEEGATEDPEEQEQETPSLTEEFGKSDENEADDAVTVPIRFDLEDFEQIREKMGLDEDADPRDLGEVLGPKIVAMYTPATPDAL